MKTKSISIALAGCFAAPVLFFACCTGPEQSLPCDIYKAGGTPCVAAHSTTRLLSSDYKGPLYQVVRDSDGATLDITADRKGYARAADQDAFLKGTTGRISIIFDQSGQGNDLVQAGPGTFNGPDKGNFNTLAIADMAPVLVNGHKAYGVYIMPGMGYRCNNAKGLAINDEAEGIYYVVDGYHYDSGCCFDYGNSSTNGKAVGTGTMETTYYGISTAWGRGNGEGPWIMSDMEAGLFSGYNHKENDVPSITDWDFVSVFVNGGDGNRWDLRGADASSDSLITFYSGVRPHTNEGSDAYYPMHKKGGMLLGNGGDNGNGSAGTFFEGVMTFGYPSDGTIAAVQKSIASTGYKKYPLSVSRLTSFEPGASADFTVAFDNGSENTPKSLSLNVEVPEGWTASVRTDDTHDGHSHALYTLTAPDSRSAGFVKVTASWKGGEVSLVQRVRCAEPVKINEIRLNTPGSRRDQFIELFNSGDSPADISGLRLDIRRSGSASVEAACIPDGTVLPAKGFYTLGLAANALTTENQTVVFTPVSTGPWMEIPAGANSLPVASVAGFAVGGRAGIDLGGHYETVTVTAVGTASTQTTLFKEAHAGDRVIYLTSNLNLRAGDELTINTGSRVETAVVKSILKAAGEPVRHFGPEPAEPHEPGSVELSEALALDHMAGVDVSCPGSGISFEPATAYAHRSGDAVQPLGSTVDLSSCIPADSSLLEPVEGASYDGWFGYAFSTSAGSVALVDPSTGAVVDAIVYGSQQSNSSANGTIASPELATLEGVQSGGGCIAVVPPAPRPAFGLTGALRDMIVGVVNPDGKSILRVPDGKDTDNLCSDFTVSEHPTPGETNVY